MAKPIKIRNRAAFFRNPKKSVDGMTSKERRKLRRAPLQEEWRRYEEMRERRQIPTPPTENRHTPSPPDTRRVVISSREEGSSSETRRSEESFDVHVDPQEYDSFLYEERRQELIAEIRTLEKMVKEKKEREKQEKKESNTKKGKS